MRVCPQLQPRVFLLAARKGMCARENVDVFPLRVQSSVRRRPALRSKTAVPCSKKRDARRRLFFCDCPQVLLSALPPTARKGVCEGGTFDGFPHSRSITRPQAFTFAQQKCCSKKKCHPKGVTFLFGAGYGSRTRLNGLGSRCNTDIPTLRTLLL